VLSNNIFNLHNIVHVGKPTQIKKKNLPYYLWFNIKYNQLKKERAKKDPTYYLEYVWNCLRFCWFKTMYD